MKKFVLIILFVFFALSAYSADWVEISEKTYIDKDTLRTYVDEYSHSHSEQIVFWRKSLNDGSEYFKNIEKEYNKKVWYTMVQEIANTKNRTMCIKSIAYYDLKGNPFFNSDIRDYALQWQSIIPNSYGEYIYNSLTNIYRAR